MSPECRNGSCLLVVKPEGASGAPASLPSLFDLQTHADVQSYMDHTLGQARMLQLAPTADLSVPPPPITVSVLSFTSALIAGVRALPPTPHPCRPAASGHQPRKFGSHLLPPQHNTYDTAHELGALHG